MQNEKESQQRREDGGNRENDNDLPLMTCSNYYNSEIPISSLSPMTGVQRLVGEYPRRLKRHVRYAPIPRTRLVPYSQDKTKARFLLEPSLLLHLTRRTIIAPSEG